MFFEGACAEGACAGKAKIMESHPDLEDFFGGWKFFGQPEKRTTDAPETVREMFRGDRKIKRESDG